jgi:hypothetical protein
LLFALENALLLTNGRVYAGPNSFRVNILNYGKVKGIDWDDYKDKNLFGVVLEIEAESPMMVNGFKSGSVTANLKDGRKLSPLILFPHKWDNVNIKTEGLMSMGNSEINIGDFKEYILVNFINKSKGDIQFYFMKKGKMKLGFIFETNMNDVNSISVLGRSIDLRDNG